MIFDIEVNNKTIKAKRGESILQALNRNGIKVPTLCFMEDFTPTGACRMCVVEVEGHVDLIPACSHPVEEWMKIKTHSPRVILARKTIVELLLANHPDDCLYCIRNGNCELQNFAEELGIRERRFSGKRNKYKIDQASSSIVKDQAKCILCGRCVRVCEEQMTVSALEFIKRGSKMVIGTTFDKPINLSSCINCGQCTIACPTGSLYEKDHLAAVYEALHNPLNHVVIQYSPTISVTLAEEYDLKPGKDVNGMLNAILHKIGFDKVFETAFGVDLAINELAAELLNRMKKGNSLPMLSGDCPAWVKYLEQVNPEMLPLLTTCKSPQQMTGAISKSFYAETRQIEPEKIVMVSVMPCTAKKFEAQREEMIQKGIADVDIVITTRELSRMIRLHGINIQQIEPETADIPMGSRSSVAKIAGIAGGETEALYRTLHFMITGKESEFFKLSEARNVRGRKEFKIEIGEYVFGFCIVNGLKYVKPLLDEIAAGKNDLHFIEVMACQGGCVNGGGQTVITDKSLIKVRSRTLYEIEEKESVKSAHKNQGVLELYKNYLGKPLSERCMTLLHTTYKERDVLL